MPKLSTKLDATLVYNPVTGLYGGARDPIWDPPVTPHENDDEFTTDSFASGQWYITDLNGVAFNREGDVDPSVSMGSNYRSTLNGSTLLFQFPAGTGAFIFKRVTRPASAFWMGALSAVQSVGPAAGVSNDPIIQLFYAMELSPGVIDLNNRCYVMCQTLASAGGATRWYRINNTAGGNPATIVGPSDATNYTMPDGLGLYQGIEQPTSNQGNHGALWNRGGYARMIADPGGVIPAFGATQIVGFSVLNQSTYNIGGPNLFAFHFFRQKPTSGPGAWLYG